MSELLSVEGIDAYYGVSHVLHQVSVNVNAGEAVLLLGRNGAGKTTLLRTIMGLVAAQGARIRFKGRDLLGMAPHRIARLGIGLVPEDRRMFARLTLRENLEVARKAPMDAAEADVRRAGRDRLWDVARVLELFPALRELQDRKSGTLSGGEQQMLTIARTLMGNPALLLLDEPAEGLAPVLAQALAEQLV